MAHRQLVWVTPQRVELLDTTALPIEVGAKARGLLWLPSVWVPTFFVLSPDFRQQFQLAAEADRSRLIDGWASRFEHGIEQAGLDNEDALYFRSNAVTETMAERGRFRSIHCDRGSWRLGLQQFFEDINASIDERVSVVVQRYVKALAVGHLSNERRVAEEYRDAAIQLVDCATGDMIEKRLSYRRWRQSKDVSGDALVCPNADDIPNVLRNPLAYAANEKRRVHYEWVWDSKVIYVVQADRASEKPAGVSPYALITKPVIDSKALSLRVFRRAGPQDATLSRKLKNHLLYESLGFRQPPIHVLHNERVLRALLAGEVDPDLRQDLVELTRRPLIIRTSVSGSTQTLLPRSDELNTVDAAVSWLTTQFAAEITRLKLSPSDLTLIAHHYIPAVAAAFSTGSPIGRDVYIEALWGIPEGLYYYPCDAYLVDTNTPSAVELRPENKRTFRVRDERRYKGTFVAPNPDGKFVVQSSKRPWDWKSVIADHDVARTIALFTRQLAASEGKAIKVMWFLDCAEWTELPSVLPWYHDFEADDWQSTPQEYKRNSRDQLIQLRGMSDLADIEEKARIGYKPQDARRLVISLNPVEDQFIRNVAVAERIGKAASSLSAVVELRGGILSHLYYVLRRAGADVSVKNVPSFAVRPEVFHKLVRDKIPAVVAAGGESAKITHLAPEELVAALRIKLVEEAFEARDARPAELVNELADVLDVVNALVKTSGISPERLAAVRRAKHERRGGFDDGVLLIETSVSPFAGPRDMQGAPILPGGEVDRVIETSKPAKLENSRVGPFDIREGEDFVEFVHTMVVGLTHSEWELASPQKIRVNPSKEGESIEWTIEGKRDGSRLKLRLKIRVGTLQLRLPFNTESSDS